MPGAPPSGGIDALVSNAPASNVREQNDLVEFAYSYPARAARVSGLAGWLDKDRETKRDALFAAARRDFETARQASLDYRPHSHLQQWRVAGDTQRFLSLASKIATYTGGAHGMSGFDSLVWDRRRSMALRPLDLFTSGEAFDAAMKPAFCEGIRRAKASRGAVTSEGADSPFDSCPAPSTQTIWLHSSDGLHFDRLTVAAAPYEVGPYAEGSYEIELGVTRALLGAVKPAYLGEFPANKLSKGP